MILEDIRRDLPSGIDVQIGEDKRPICYGHAAAGSVFILAGIFWMITFSLGLKNDDDNITANTRRHGIFVLLRKIPFEGCYWFTTGSIALVQIFSVSYFHLKITNDSGEYVVDSLKGWQHVALGVPFVVHGGTKILAESLYSSLTCWVGPTGITAFGLFSLINFLHAYGRDPLDAHIHYILGAIALSTTIFFAAEYFSTSLNKKILFFPKTFFILLQGTWMIQAAFILDPSNVTLTRGSSVNVIMFTSTILVWHIIIDMTFLVLLYIMLKLVFKMAEYSNKKYMELSVEEEDTVPLVERSQLVLPEN